MSELNTIIHVARALYAILGSSWSIVCGQRAIDGRFRFGNLAFRILKVLLWVAAILCRDSGCTWRTADTCYRLSRFIDSSLGKSDCWKNPYCAGALQSLPGVLADNVMALGALKAAF
jgi:hypothetical protein